MLLKRGFPSRSGAARDCLLLSALVFTFEEEHRQRSRETQDLWRIKPRGKKGISPEPEMPEIRVESLDSGYLCSSQRLAAPARDPKGQPAIP